MSEFREALRLLVRAVDDTMREHAEHLGCCSVTRKRLDEAKALLARGEPEQCEMSDADVRRHYNTACDVFGIGSEARKSGYVLSTNCENAKRRSDCLSLIEREFFTSIEQDEEGEEGECVEKCELPWGAEPDRYVKKFGELLAARVEPAAAEKARELQEVREALSQLLPAAREILWCALVWNDHNFDHEDLRKKSIEAAKALGFDKPGLGNNIEAVNRWMERLHKALDVPSPPAETGEAKHELCSDCPPRGYPTDKTRCDECPRGAK